MINILFWCIGALTLLFMFVCIWAVVDLTRDKRKKDDEWERFKRRLP